METKRVRIVGPPAASRNTVAGAAAAAVAADRRARSDARWASVVTYTIAVGSFALTGWLLMIVVGIVHHHWLPGLPTLDWVTANWIVALIQVMRYVDQR